MSDWDVKLLDEVVEYFIDYRGKTPSKVGEGIPLVTAKIVKNGRIAIPNEFISIEDYPKWMTRGYPEIDDVVLTTEAPLGEVALIKNKDVALAQRIITLRGYKDFLDNRFLKYWLQSEQGQYELESRASGTTVFGIKSSVLKKIPITLPGINEQKTIASVLSSLDDKIDLLHRQNKTLESMAETLFRKWFVEDVQDGWAQAPLSSIAIFTNGLACQKYPPKPGLNSLPVLKIKELSTGITSDSAFVNSDIDPKYIVEHGDVIFAWSASLMVKIWSGPQCVLNQHLFNVKSTEYPKWFYYAWCRYHLRQFISISESHATTMGHIKRKDLDEAMVLIPSDSKLEEMTKIMTPLLDMQIEKSKQINQLQSLRDTLLPKLMSGEVRVKYEELQV